MEAVKEVVNGLAAVAVDRPKASWVALRPFRDVKHKAAGTASFYAGARHGVARCGTCAALGGGSLAVAALARRGQRRLLNWRASRCGAGRHTCRLRRWRLGRRCAHATRAAPSSTLARVTLWREAAHVLPQAAAAWPSLRLLDAGSAGSWAGARLGVARGGTRAASGGGGLAVAALARSGLRRLLRWRASRCGARWRVCAASGGDGYAVAALTRRGRRRLLRWRASHCGARRHVCCLSGRRCTRSTLVAPASTLARVTV